MRISALLAASLATVGFAQLAVADSSANLQVTANVIQSCQIGGGYLGFGSYDSVNGGYVFGTGQITVACAAGTETTITLDEGQAPQGGSSLDAPARRMNNGGGSFLSYQLFTEPSLNTTWGGTPQSGRYFFAPDSNPQAIPVYGLIPAGQSVPSGGYGDNVTATIQF
jgi:spore coat protein U-like protein